VVAVVVLVRLKAEMEIRVVMMEEMLLLSAQLDQVLAAVVAAALVVVEYSQAIKMAARDMLVAMGFCISFGLDIHMDSKNVSTSNYH
jgi:hypothetical protein